MKQILSEKNVVVILFVMVLITFSLAQEDSRKMEKLYTGATSVSATSLLKIQDEIKVNGLILKKVFPASVSE